MAAKSFFIFLSDRPSTYLRYVSINNVFSSSSWSPKGFQMCAWDLAKLFWFLFFFNPTRCCWVNTSVYENRKMTMKMRYYMRHRIEVDLLLGLDAWFNEWPWYIQCYIYLRRFYVMLSSIMLCYASKLAKLISSTIQNILSDFELNRKPRVELKLD